MNVNACGKRGCRRWLWLAALLSLTLGTLPTFAQNNHSRFGDDDDQKSATPPGLFITPTALPHAVQQLLNPGLINYPNFVAGEAVKAVVSPDGKTLAILTAGMNSLYFPNVGEPSTNPTLAKSTQAPPHSSSFFMMFQVPI